MEEVVGPSQESGEVLSPPSNLLLEDLGSLVSLLGHKEDDIDAFDKGPSTPDDVLTSMQSIVERYTAAMKQHSMTRVIGCTELEVEVRNLLSAKSQANKEDLILSLVQLMEEIRILLEYQPHNSHAHPPGPQISLAVPLQQQQEQQEEAQDESVCDIPVTPSMRSVVRPPVFETDKLSQGVDANGRKLINRYTILGDLGFGGHGKVKLGENCETGAKVAIKVIKKKQFRSNGRTHESNLWREIRILKNVRHRNCVALLEVIDDPKSGFLYLVMEYIPNGPVVKIEEHPVGSLERFTNAYLLEHVQRNNKVVCCEPLPESRCADYFWKLVSGLRYLHKHKVVHHDIKPDNILCGYGNQVYISDFSVSEMLVRNGSKKIGVPTRYGAGTPMFAAPEHFQQLDGDKPNPFLSDVWALGVTLYFMLVGVAPFNGQTYFEMMKEVMHEPFPWNGRNAYGKQLNPRWKKILDGMLEKDPHRRWSLEALKKFLKEDKRRESESLAEREQQWKHNAGGKELPACSTPATESCSGMKQGKQHQQQQQLSKSVLSNEVVTLPSPSKTNNTGLMPFSHRFLHFGLHGANGMKKRA
ncbi:protein kinase [Trypanosoma grayi]|uniref:protein kinase n=1 Tax=Trypanosoma grayi TaxID=71804 RepID=UPI0004F42030|nr:protein kinase [Trypanosoma grayi]KEG12975.1 protein kinase [Trypanosoma grayi]